MAHRIDAFLTVLEDRSAPAIAGHEPVDDALLGLLAHVAFADGQVGDAEFALLGRLFPWLEAGDILGRVAAVLETGLDIDALGAALPSPIERAKALRFATHMAWADDQMDPGESELIRELALKLGVAPQG